MIQWLLKANRIQLMDSGDSHYMIHTNSKIAQKYGTQSTNKSKHKQTLVLTYQTRGTAAPQGISTNITTRLIHILPSDYMLP